MKKRILTIVLFLSFLIVFNLNTIKLFAYEDSSNLSINQVYLSNLSQSIKIYSQIILEFQVRTDFHNNKEYMIYNENYAGAYIDDTGMLNIAVVNNNNSVNYMSSDYSQVIYQEFTYSYNFLQKVLNSIEDIMLESSVYIVGIDDELNHVFVELNDETDVEVVIQHLQNEELYEPNALYFEVDSDGGLSETSNITYGGESIFHRYTTGIISRGTFAVNAVCKDTGRIGVLTNAHVAPYDMTMSYGGYWDESISSFTDEIFLGTASKSRQQNTIDAAFIPYADQSKWEITPYAKYNNIIYDDVWLGNDNQIIKGQPIMRIGQTTGVTSGKIRSTNTSAKINGKKLTNLFRFTNPPEKGDSGGPIYYTDGDKLYLIGLNFGVGNNIFNKHLGYACRISNVMSDLNVTPITNDSFNTTILEDGTIQLDGLNFDVSGEFVIPSSLKGKIVSKIGENAFSNNNGITQIIVPPTITSISNGAFKNCLNLKEIIIQKETDITNVGTDVFSGCSSLEKIVVPTSKIFRYKEDTNWSEYSNLIKYVESSSNYDFHCRMPRKELTFDISQGETILYMLNIECPIQYMIDVEASSKLIMNIYDENMDLIANGLTIESGGKHIVFSCPSLQIGKAYIEIYMENNLNFGDITIQMYPHTSTNNYIKTGNKVNVLTHLHENKNEFLITASAGDLLWLKVEGLVNNNLVNSQSSISIKDFNGNVIEKCSLSEYFHSAESVSDSNNIMFYASNNETYKIYLEVADLDYYELTLTVLQVTDFTCFNMNNEDRYFDEISMPLGDFAYVYNFERIGTYNIILEYLGNQTNDMLFVLFETNDSNEYTYKNSFAINSSSNFIDLTETLTSSKKILLCVFDSIGMGNLNISISKQIDSKKFTIYTDSSSVKEPIVMTQGFTQICYLGSDAPNTSSRYKYYNWYSVNTNVAIVSNYGTITAVDIGETTIQCVYKEDPSIIATLDIKVVEDTSTIKVRLKYGFDIREDGTISGTEVTSGLVNVIEVAQFPDVTIHKGYTRLICLGDDSPNSSIQAFTWTAYQEEGDNGMVTVSSFGTIQGTVSGWVTVKGVYKYNSNYEVYIRIYVE